MTRSRTAATDLSCLAWGEGFGSRLTATLQQRQGQLYLRRQRIAVDVHWRLPGQEHLYARRKPGEHPSQTVLEVLAQRQ